VSKVARDASPIRSRSQGNEPDVILVKIAARREGSGGGNGSNIGYRKPASTLNFDPWTSLAAWEHVEGLTAEHGP
jgi:hypothetical protein